MAQQAHHIIPVAVFNNIAAANLDINFGTLFGEIDGRNFQQMGSNFIYLYEEANYAQKTASLLQNSPNIYGDLSIGGAQHSGSHNGYNDFIETRLRQIFNSNLNFTSEERKMMVLDLQRGLKEILIDGNPDVMNAANFDAQRMNIALDNKGVLSPITFSTTSDIYKNAEKMLDDFNNGRAFTQVFDAGTRSTDAFAVHNAKMIYENTKELNEITSFLTEKSLEHFKDNAITSPKHARNVILSATYDTEKYLSSVADVEKITGKSLDKFTSEFKETVSLSFTHNLDATGQTKLSNLKDSLKVQALDAKAVKLMADLRTDKKVFLDFNGVDDAKFQGSALWDVLDHIGNSNEFDDVELNGKKISDWKINVTDFDGKTQKLDFKQTIYLSSIQYTQLAMNEDNKFDREKFKNIDFNNIELDVKNFHETIKNQIDKFNTDVAPINKSLYAKGFKSLPVVGLILGATLTAQQANAATTEEEEKEIWAEFAAGEIGSEVASWGAGIISGAILVGIGVTTGPVAIAAGIAVSIVAGIYGEEAGKDLYNLTKDMDKNGKSDLLDRMGALLFGQNVPESEIPKKLKSSQPLTLNINMTVDELVTKARNNIAYRYALKELNPFVIEGANYEPFNKDGSLNLLDKQNPQGMSEQYLKDRATMLLLQVKYLQNGLKLGHDLISHSIQGDWDFYDYGKHPFAGEQDRPLVFSIDGNGISIDDHIIAFGTKGNDTFDEGSSENDRFYGGTGDDTFKSSKGDDYMEGGTEFDTYIIEGNDTIFDSDNNGQVVIGNTKIFEFKLPQDSTDVWKSVDAGGNFDNQFIAIRKDNDLMIRALDNGSMGNVARSAESDDESNSVTIKDFFSLANSADNKITGLNITLHTEPKQPEKQKGNLWVGDSHPVIDEYGYYDKEGWNNRDETGKIINGIDAENFNDMIQSDDNDSIIKGLGGHDALSGGAGNDFIEGGEGFDMLFGGGGKDTLYGGNGNDFIHSSPQLSFPRRIRPDDEWKAPRGANIEKMLSITTNTLWGVYEEKNSDIIMFHNAKAAPDDLGDDIFGGNGNDVIVGSNHDDYIHGDGFYLDKDQSKIVYESGNDSLYGSGGNDIIYGGLGNDSLTGDITKNAIGTPQSEHGMDTLYGNEGNDVLEGFGHDDIVDGGSGDDKLFGDSSLSLVDLEYHGDDILYGREGNDQLVGNGGNDTLYGGEDNDTLWGDTDEPDIIGDDILYGESGNDILIGGSGNDFLSGGTGDDLLEGGLGEDFLSGGIGNDTLVGNESNDTLFGGDGIDNLLGDQYTDKNINSESYGDDILYGDAGDDELIGLGGSDQLYGGEGNDKLYGDGAEDVTRNDNRISGKDILYGGEGNDYVDGGRDDDILYGGEGHDALVGASGNNKLYGGIGFDTYIITSTDVQTNIIQDDDNKGRIAIDSMDYSFLLWTFDSQEQHWFANDTDIVLKQNSNGSLSIFNKNNDEIATIEKFTNGALGIYLDNSVIKNQAPKVVNQINPKNAKANQAFEQNLGNDLFQDEDDNLTYVVTLADGSPLPNWLTFDANAMTLSGTPTKDDAGTIKLKITATDKEGLSSHQTWSFQVELPPNEAPTLTTTQIVSEIKENEQLTLVYSDYINDDGGFDKLKFNLSMADGSALPNWLNTQDDRATLTPNFDAAGTYQLNVTAQDEEGLTTSLQWQINVNDVNRAPVVSGSLNTQTLSVGRNWQIKLPTSLLFKEEDQNDTLSYRVEMANGSALPNWLTFDAHSQVLSVQPTESGNISLKLIATDSHNESAFTPINLLINPAEPSNPIVPTPPTVQEGSNKIGSSGNDTLTGTALNDVLDGSFGNDQLYGLNGDDTLKGGAGQDTLRGDNGNDTLDGSFDNDILYGGAGNDVLLGGFADDVLIGGQGNDKLNGGIGNDTYIFNLGDGQDTIQDQLGKDTLKINGLKLSDVLFMQEGRKLVIDSKISDDSVTIENYYLYPKNVLNLLKPSRPTEFGDKIETIEFADGQSLDYAQVDRMVQALEQLNSHSTY